MARSRMHILNYKHLGILRWLDLFSVTPDRPEGWCLEARIMRGMRFHNFELAIKTDPQTKARSIDRNGPLTACGEELVDLCVKLNDRDDPFVIIHPNGKSYRISRVGRKIARACTVRMKKTPTGEIAEVFERATGKPPRIESTENIPQADSEEDLEDDSQDIARDPNEAEGVQEPDLEGEDALDDERDDQEPAAAPRRRPRDEINDEPEYQPPARPAPPRRPTAKPAAIRTPTKPNPPRRPTRAAVPAQDE